MGKIIKAELIKMLDQGFTQRQIAAEMKVSEPAVCQAIQKMRRVSNRPEVLDRLTSKEVKYCSEVASGASQTAAALMAYDAVSRESAKVIGSQLSARPEIQEGIAAILNSEGMGKRYLVRRLRQHVDDPDPNVSLRATDMGLKLHDVYPSQKNINLNLNAEAAAPVDLSKYS